MRKRILVLADVNLGRDARIQRQLAFLRDDYELSCLTWRAAPVEGVRYLELGPLSESGLAKKLTGAALSVLTSFESQIARRPFMRLGLERAAPEDFDLVLANDVDTLPLAMALAKGKGARLLLDAHEYAPGQFDNSLRWRLSSGRYIRRLCRAYLGKVDGMITVCESIARLYAEEYGVSPVVVTNAPEYAELEPSPTNPAEIRLVYHGSINRNRRIENMLRVLEALPERFSLTMMVNNAYSPYGQELKAAGGARVSWVPPVAHEGVAEAINGYDIGLYLLEPQSTNQRLALPNKFFEFVQGRLAVAVGPSVEMAAAVRKHDLGVVAADFSPSALARELDRLTIEDIDRFKRNSAAAARLLNAEANRRILLETVGSLL